jgi:hypothetical protein
VFVVNKYFTSIHIFREGSVQISCFVLKVRVLIQPKNMYSADSDKLSCLIQQTVNVIDEKFLNEAPMKLLPVMKILIKPPTDKNCFSHL